MTEQTPFPGLLDGWAQVSVHHAQGHSAEQVAFTHLKPTLARAQHDGLLARWWFIRKEPCWHWRYRPTDGHVDHARARIEQTLAKLGQDGVVEHWAHTLYEPETRAFGGTGGMQAAHGLFHADSRHLLDHLARHGQEHRAVLAVLRICALLRGAEQDWYEQGEVFAQLAAHRPAPRASTTTEVDQLGHLLTADAHSSLMDGHWTQAFHATGSHLGKQARNGSLTRGLRAVLAHHALFAWNRAGLGATEQGLLAQAALAAVFDRNAAAHPPNTPATTACPTTVTRVNTINTNETAHLRQNLVSTLRRRGTFQTPEVEAAFAAVPRHVFLPEVDTETAYQPQVVITKRDSEGAALSSASHPNMVAAMLEQLDARPGHRVLEIGAATGINAALIAELVGPSGHVSTLEVDADLTERARQGLVKAGYERVQVLCADGALGHPPGAPFDRIIVTAGAWTIPAAWWAQLAPNGRIVVPLRLHGSGLTRCLPFDRTAADQMVATSALVCGFVPLRGASDSPGLSLDLAEGVSLSLAADDEADTVALQQALTSPARERWTGITMTEAEDTEHLDLWLATHDGHFARLTVTPQAREHGINPTLRWAGAAIHDGTGSLAYLTLREIDETTEELGITAHGPDPAGITDHLQDLLKQWSKQRPGQPRITAHPAGTPAGHLPVGSSTVTKPDTVFTLSW